MSSARTRTQTVRTAYVNAVQDRYALKKTSTSASVGLSVLGSLSLPIGSGSDSMVKIASETIPAGVFYERFLNLVDHFLKVDPGRRDRATVKAAKKEHVAPLPEPAPTHAGEPMKMTAPTVPTPPASPVPVQPAAPAPAPAIPSPSPTSKAPDGSTATTYLPSEGLVAGVCSPSFIVAWTKLATLPSRPFYRRTFTLLLASPQAAMGRHGAAARDAIVTKRS